MDIIGVLLLLFLLSGYNSKFTLKRLIYLTKYINLGEYLIRYNSISFGITQCFYLVFPLSWFDHDSRFQIFLRLFLFAYWRLCARFLCFYVFPPLNPLPLDPCFSRTTPAPSRSSHQYRFSGKPGPNWCPASS